MRMLLAMLCCLIVVCAAVAQPPGGGDRRNGPGASLGPVRPAGQAQPALDPEHDRLDALLLQWEARMKNVTAILVKDCVRTDKDKSGTKTWKGEARYLKPNLAALRLVQQEDSKFYELIVSTGQYLYQYSPQFKKLSIQELPPPRAGNFDNNLLSFLFGMSALDAKRRYDLTLSKDLSETNKHWIYIDIKPRDPADKREFTRAQLVLFAGTMLPRRVWFEHPNGDEVTWDLPDMDPTVQLRVTDFRPPEPPKGWETVRVPLERTPVPDSGKPRVIRSGADK